MLDVDRALERARLLGGGVFGLALEEGCGPGIDQQRVAGLDLLGHLIAGGDVALVQRGRELGSSDLRHHVVLRQFGAGPGLHAAVEHRQLLHAQHLQRPVHAGGAAKVGGVGAAGDDDGMAVRAQSQALHQLRELGQGGQVAGVAGRAAPLAVGRRDGPGDVALGIRLGLADIDDAHLWRLGLRLQIGRAEQGLGGKRAAGRRDGKGELEDFFHGGSWVKRHRAAQQWVRLWPGKSPFPTIFILVACSFW